MALFFLDYDLRNQQNYQQLYDELESYGAVRVLESTWCFKKSGTDAKTIREHFKSFIDKDDGICVTEVVSWATLRTDGNPNDLK